MNAITLDPTILGFSLLMIILFLWELISKKDLKSVIVSLGVLGTFVGIALGLLEFDSSNISNSVPTLLNGLKIAFITSIVGMSLSTILSIKEKLKNEDSSYNEIEILNNINNRLLNLEHINTKLDDLSSIKSNSEYLLLTNSKLDSIDSNIKNLSSDISSVKNELKINQNLLFDFLKEKLEIINNNLKDAVDKLSEGATEEIIKALENVIHDFNNNLTEQFGDNFKQLNESVINMIEWQNNYKEAIKSFDNQLKITTEITENSLNKSTDLFIKNSDSLISNTNLINTTTSENTNKLINDVNTFSTEINKTITGLFEKVEIAVLTTENNTKSIKDITEDYSNISKISNKLIPIIKTMEYQVNNLDDSLQSLSNISSGAKEVTNEISSFCDEIKKSLTMQSQALTSLTQEIENQLPSSLDTLNKSLTSLTKQFSSDYEKFLEQISILMQSNNSN